MSPADEHFLRRAIALAAEAVARGDRPFGAVVVDGAGLVVAEANATAASDVRDWTAHSEMTALRAASAVMSWEALAGCTLYASGEPCPMCASALYWCNVRRLVFGASEASIRSLRQRFTRAAGIEMSCREVFARAPHPIAVEGPCLEAEALRAHHDFWPHAADDV
jgi:tRNA(Arg) A34 adenosine deaminase TadA